MRKEGLCQNGKKWPDDNFITHKLEEAFGYSDQQLVEEFDRAATLYAQSPDPRLKPPEGEFQKIMERVEKEKKAERKVIRLKKVLRPMLVAALLGGAVLGSGIGVNGLEGMDYGFREREEGDVIFNNMGHTEEISDIEQVYKDIEETIGISAIELSYMPEKMAFEEVLFNELRAKIKFVYEGNYFYFHQALWNLDESANYRSDRKLYKEVYNRYLDINIPIYKNELEGEKPEFGAQFICGDAYYYCYGIIEEKEFIKIVKHIKYYEN